MLTGHLYFISGEQSVLLISPFVDRVFGRFLSSLQMLDNNSVLDV